MEWGGGGLDGGRGQPDRAQTIKCNKKASVMEWGAGGLDGGRG